MARQADDAGSVAERVFECVCGMMAEASAAA